MRNLLLSFFISVISQFLCDFTYAESTCYASSSETLNNCIYKIKNDLYDKIEITQSFTCNVNGVDCNFLIQGITKPVELYGTVKSITIKRNPNVILFKIEESANITIKNLTISDNLSETEKEVRLSVFTQPCPQANEYISHDFPIFTIGKNVVTGFGSSDSIHINNIVADTVAPNIMELDRVNNILITNSEFSGAGHFGIWTSNNDSKHYIRIFDNKFHDIGANAIILAKSDLVEISGNTFSNNHKLNPFCYLSSHTGGGQLDIEQGSTNVKIQSNVIERGGNTAVCGIEFSDGSKDLIKNINVYANRIYGNPSGGIIFNARESSNDGVQMVSIQENAFYENKFPNVQINGHRDISINSNYYSKDFSQSPRANFIGTPNTCNLNGLSTCNVNIIWSSLGLSKPNIIVDGVGLFSINPSGNQAASWIGSSGSVFEIFGDNLYMEPVARIYIKGI